MEEIAPGIFLVPGENRSLFPFCTCLYLKGRNLRVLIDAGMGDARMDACLREGTDVLILTHCHFDHQSTIGRVRGIPVWCHDVEVPYLEDRDVYLRETGIFRSGIDIDRFFKRHPFPDLRVDKRLADGERIDLGGLTLQVVHAPGHTPGHCAFYFPEANFLFSADVALNTFGPFYGNDFGDIEDFIASIRKLKALGASTVATSHSGPFRDRLVERFSQYEDIIYRRDELILEYLSGNQTLAGFLGKHVVYKDYPEPREVTMWMELVQVEKHLQRLIEKGRVRKEGDLYIKT